MTKTPVPVHVSRSRWVVVFGVLAAGVVLLAACGGSPSNDASVAHLQPTTTTQGASSHHGHSQPHGSGPTGSSGSNGGSGPSTNSNSSGGPGPGQQRFAISGGNQTQMLAFAHCMQTHGVPNFPEPNSQGVVQGSGLNPGSPSFQSASKDCRHLLPNGGQPTAAQQAQAMHQALKFSECMRSHGIADFPDPQPGPGGGIRIALRAGKGSDLNPQSPQFQSAQTACQSIMGGPKGPFATHGGPSKA